MLRNEERRVQWKPPKVRTADLDIQSAKAAAEECRVCSAVSVQKAPVVSWPRCIVERVLSSVDSRQ